MQHNMTMKSAECSQSVESRNYKQLISLPTQASVCNRSRHATMHKSAMTRFLDADHLLDGVNFLEPRILKKTEPSDAEDCVEDVNHISRSICQTTQIRILQKSEVAMNCS